MARKANLGRDRATAIQMTGVLNTKYRLQIEQNTTQLEAPVDFGSPRFDAALESFADKYIASYRLKSTTAALLPFSVDADGDGVRETAAEYIAPQRHAA